VVQVIDERLRLRLSVALAVLATLVLVDEAIKEGYVFDPADLVNPALTHEKLFVALLLLALALGVRRRGKRASA
jgi:MYXO-CTERM domain-containing protein